MIAKFFKPAASSLPALIRYVTREGRADKRAEAIGGNMISSDSLALLREFRVSIALRPSVRRPLVHASLSIAPGLQLGTTGWRSACEAFLHELGFEPLNEHQYIIIQHLDTQHAHVHVIASRISVVTGALVREVKGDYFVAHRAVAAAARRVGFEPVVPGRSEKKASTLFAGPKCSAR